MFYELVDYISVGVKERDYVVDVAFPNQWFVSTLINDMRFEFRQMFTKAAAFLVTTAFPYVCKYLCSLNWNELRRCFLWEGLWNEGSISLKTSKAAYTMFLPSTCEMFVYKLVTCIETSITSFGSFFFSEKFML